MSLYVMHDTVDNNRRRASIPNVSSQVTHFDTTVLSDGHCFQST